MAIDDFRESPVFFNRSKKLLVVNIRDDRKWPDLHASENTNEQQDDEHSDVEDKAKVY